MLLSACMIVKNEAQVLPAALRSLSGRVDEIVVLDTGSSDGTPGVAEAAGARVLSIPWQDDFSHARNAALSAARGRFCLMLDADEEVIPSSWPALLGRLHGAPRDLYRVIIESETEGGLVRETVTRICRRAEHIRYHGRIHEQLLGGPGATGADSGLVLRHSGYTAAALLRKGTAQRNRLLLEAALLADPRDPYLHFQLGRTLLKTHRDDACRHLQQALVLCQAQRDAPPYLPGLVRDLGYGLRDSKKPQQALALVRAYQPRFPDFTDLWFLEGLLHLDAGRAEDMLRSFQRCLALGEAPPRYGSVAGAGSFRAHHNLGLFFELAGVTDVARRHYQAALLAAPDFLPARDALLRLTAAGATSPLTQAGVARTIGGY